MAPRISSCEPCSRNHRRDCLAELRCCVSRLSCACSLNLFKSCGCCSVLPAGPALSVARACPRGALSAGLACHLTVDRSGIALRRQPRAVTTKFRFCIATVWRSKSQHCVSQLCFFLWSAGVLFSWACSLTMVSQCATLYASVAELSV